MPERQSISPDEAQGPYAAPRSPLPEKPRRHVGPLVDAVLLAAGLLLSGWLVYLGYATADPQLRIEWDLRLMIALLLGPTGLAFAFTLRLILRRRVFEWSSGEWLWPLIASTGLGWCEVWLDRAERLGKVGLAVGGALAVFGTLIIAMAAVAILLYSMIAGLTSRKRFAADHWLGIAVGFALGAGGALFIAVFREIQF